MFNKYKPFLFGGTLFIFGVAIGTLGCYFFFPKTITNTVEIEKPIVQETVKYVDRTEVVYVPKASPADADIEITKTQPVVKVDVNGKNYDFKLNQTENHKFDNGKLVVDQAGVIAIDVRTNEDKRRWTLKLGKSNNSVAGGLDYNLNNIINIWTFYDKETIAGGVGVKF